MKHREKQKLTIVLGIFLLVCCGCAKKEENLVNEHSYVTVTAMENTPILDYTIPELTANIIIDTKSYQTGCRKEAAVKGEILPQNFRLIDSATEEVVYEGNIENDTFYEELGLYVGYADFTEYTKEGTFYLQCDYIGESYDFFIQENMYQELFEEALQKCIQNCRNMTMTLEDAVIVLTVYEWYPQLFELSEDNETPEILQIFAEWIKNQEMQGITSENSLYAAFLAKFGYFYQNYDKKYATQCLNKASGLLEKMQETGEDAQNFFVLTELYRATGLSSYRKQIQEYKMYFEDNSGSFEKEEYLYGAITYMVTRRKVDVELCNILIDHIMRRGEEIDGHYKEMINPVFSQNNGEEDIRKRMTELACANYVMSNYQYQRILEDFLHYLMGKNVQSVCFYEKPKTGTEYLLVLAQLTVQTENNDVLQELTNGS